MKSITLSLQLLTLLNCVVCRPYTSRYRSKKYKTHDDRDYNLSTKEEIIILIIALTFTTLLFAVTCYCTRRKRSTAPPPSKNNPYPPYNRTIDKSSQMNAPYQPYQPSQP